LKDRIDEMLPAPLEKSWNLIWYGELSLCIVVIVVVVFPYDA